MARKSINTQTAPVEETPVFSRRPINTAAQIATQSADVQQPVESGKTVTVRIPKNFSLTLADYTQVHYQAGVDEMPVEHATHWYAKAIGVEIHEPKRG